MAKPGLEAGAKGANAELRTLLPADHGLALYSNGIAATEDFIARNPSVLQRFVRAALKGWKLAMANPEKAAADQIKYVPTLKPETIVAEVKVVADLAVTDETRKNGLGWFDPARMQSNIDFVVKYIGINGTPPVATDLYAGGFLPTPGIMP
jgi:NitT/TauT family transport system substrate-binding protein